MWRPLVCLQIQSSCHRSAQHTEGSEGSVFGQIAEALRRFAGKCFGVSARSVRRGEGLPGLVGRVPTPLEEGG